MNEQKLDELMKEYFSEKEDISPALKREIRTALLKAEADKQKRQFFLLALAVVLYSIGMFAVFGTFAGNSPVGLWLLINMCLAVVGSSILVLVARKQYKYKEA